MVNTNPCIQQFPLNFRTPPGILNRKPAVETQRVSDSLPVRKKLKIQIVHFPREGTFALCDLTGFPREDQPGDDFGVKGRCLHIYIKESGEERIAEAVAVYKIGNPKPGAQWLGCAADVD